MNRNKTIGIVVNTAWNIYNFRIGLINALKENGYKVIAIAPKDEYSEKLKNIVSEYHEIEINNKGTNPFEEIKLIYNFYKLYKKTSPDILLHFTIKPNIYGSLAAYLLGIPVINNITGLGTVFLNNSFFSITARILYKMALKVPKKIFFQNPDDKNLFLSLKLIDENKTDLLPGSGIDTEKFKPLENVKTTYHFLLIARLLKDKGVVEFIEAARLLKKEHPEIQFAILGDFYPGNPSAVTKKEIEKWELEGIIKYLGTTDDVRSVIATSECVVLPSYREGLPRVLLEAGSMAKPIITTDVPGCKEVVIHGVQGYLCKVRDHKSLATKMKKMFHLDKKTRKQMGEKGRKLIINKFDEKIVIEKYLKTISDINKQTVQQLSNKPIRERLLHWAIPQKPTLPKR